MQFANGWRQWLVYTGQILLLAVTYYATAKASLLLAIAPGYATAVWPPSGIALAALLTLGNRVWPGIWLGAALVNLTVAASPLAAVLIGSGNTLEALAAAALVRRHIASEAPFFDRVRHVVRFVAYAMLCSAIAATIGVGSLAITGAVPWSNVVENWGTWWHGDTAGIVIVTPLILTWCVRHQIAWTPRKLGEAAALVVSLLIIAFAVFGHGTPDSAALPLTFAILPVIVWAAFRFSRREVTTAVAVICLIAVWNTVEGRGPFAQYSLNLELLLLLAFISTVVATGLMLSAAVGERARSLSRLADALQEVQAQARTDPLTTLANRRHLWEFLQREWIRARRRKSPLAVIMIDLDHFKRLNDTYGHDAGDSVLTEVANLLKAQIRGSDIAWRRAVSRPRGRSRIAAAGGGPGDVRRQGGRPRPRHRPRHEYPPQAADRLHERRLSRASAVCTSRLGPYDGLTGGTTRRTQENPR